MNYSYFVHRSICPRSVVVCTCTYPVFGLSCEKILFFVACEKCHGGIKGSIEAVSVVARDVTVVHKWYRSYHTRALNRTPYNVLPPPPPSLARVWWMLCMMMREYLRSVFPTLLKNQSHTLSPSRQVFQKPQALPLPISSSHSKTANQQTIHFSLSNRLFFSKSI